jgi:type II secretory pathway component PulL
MEDRLQNQPTGSWDSSSMDNALALALMDTFGIKGLNFRRGPFALKKRWLEHRKSLIRTGIFAAIALIVMLANVGIDYYAKQKKLNDLKMQIETIFLSTFPDVRKVVDPLNQMQIKMEQARKSTLSPAQSENSLLMIDVLNALSKRIPAPLDVRFTRMVIGEDNVTITGNTDTFNTVDSVKGRLEADDMFQTVTIVSTNKDKTGNRIRFRLKVKI